MKPQEPNFMDPDEFSLRHLEEVKSQIIKALEFRIEDLRKDEKERFVPERVEELEKIGRYVETLTYKTDSWKYFFPEKEIRNEPKDSKSIKKTSRI